MEDTKILIEQLREAYRKLEFLDTSIKAMKQEKKRYLLLIKKTFEL